MLASLRDAFEMAGASGPLLYYFLLFAWAVYAFETWLDLRQHRTFAVKQRPAELTYLTDEEFAKAQAYGRDKSSFHFLSSLWNTLKLTGMLLAGYYPAIWSFSGVLMKELLGYDPASHDLIHTCVFYIVDAAIETVLSLPVTAYSTFVIEQRHGFNKQTVGLFVSDTIKGFLLNCAIAPPLLCLFVSVIEWGGEHFYLYVAGLMFVVQVLAVPFYSQVIQPCFNKVEPLPAGSLRTKIEQLAASVKFPLTELFVIDGSKRSSHSNAYFYGFWKSKRIVLFDTLIKQCSEGQVVAVLGHEIGHWHLSHTVKNLLLGQVQMLALFFLFGQAMHHPSLYTDFGFVDTRPTYIGLLLFSFLYSPVQHVLAFGMNVLSRKFEFEADAYAVSLGYANDLGKALTTLQTENKSTPISDPLYSAYHRSHPTLLQRLEAIDAARQQQARKTE